jgi:hypothetical protein
MCPVADGGRSVRSQLVGRTLDAKRAPVQHVRVDHGRAHVSVAEQFLHGADDTHVLNRGGRGVRSRLDAMPGRGGDRRGGLG